MRNFLRPFLLFILTLEFGIPVLLAQGPWTQRATFPGPGRHRSFNFTIGSRGYVGGGWIGVQLWGDFWEYDPATNSWTQKANLPTGAALSPAAFSIGNKGYYVLGWDINYNDILDLWEYSPASNTWTAKAPWPSVGNWGAEGFSIGNRAYVGEPGTYDMYVYDQPTDQWLYTTSNFYFGWDEVALTLNGKGYFATSQNGSELWSYDPGVNYWTQQATLPAPGITESSGFAVGGKIYIGTGQWLFSGERLADFWEFNPATNSWRKVNDLPGVPRDDASGFAIDGKGYLCTGTNGMNLQDHWEFNPALATAIGENDNKPLNVSVYPNPMHNSTCLRIGNFTPGTVCDLNLFGLDGRLVRTEKITGENTIIHRHDLSSGTYIFSVYSEGAVLASGKLIVELTD